MIATQSWFGSQVWSELLSLVTFGSASRVWLGLVESRSVRAGSVVAVMVRMQWMARYVLVRCGSLVGMVLDCLVQSRQSRLDVVSLVSGDVTSRIDRISHGSLGMSRNCRG